MAMLEKLPEDAWLGEHTGFIHQAFHAVAACQEATSGQRAAGVTTMPTPGTATR